MSRSPAISALLLLALCIVSNVLSAPTEEIIREESTREEFRETREAEVSARQTRASRNERFDMSREAEMLHRPARLVEKPTSDKPEVKAVDAKKVTTLDDSKENSSKNAATSEAKDMTQTHAEPKDDDDSADSATALSKVPENTKKDCAGAEKEANKKSTDAPREFPKDDTVKSPKDEPKMYNKLITHVKSEDDAANDKKTTTVAPVTSAEATDKTSAISSSTISTTTVTTAPVVTTEAQTVATSPTAPTVIADATTKATATSTPTSEKPAVTPPVTESTSAISAVTAEATKSPAPTITVTTTEKPTSMTISSSTNSDVITDQPMPIGSTEMSQAEKDLHAKKPRKEEKAGQMPSGIVALITAIAFAIVAVMAYIGLVTWRRYLEWRYGNRELLVNEFDSNDIGNFEL